MRLSLGSIAAVTATILITSALWPPMPAVNVPPQAVAQQQKPPARKPGLLDNLSAPLPKDVTPKVQKADQQATVEAKLNTQIEPIAFKDTPLRHALDFISNQIKVDILFNQKSLKDAGIKLDEPVSLTLKHTAVTAATALELILERAARKELTFRIRDGFIYVQTAIENDEDLDIVVYNVRDLLTGSAGPQPSTTFRGGGARGMSRRPSMRGLGLGGGGEEGMGSGLAVMNRPSMRRSSQAAAGILRKLIMNTTSGPWFDVDGVGGTVEHFNGLLVVRQSSNNHREIKQLLEMMRAAVKQKRTVGAKAPRPLSSAPVPLPAEPLGIQYAIMIHRDIAAIRDQILDGGLPGGKAYSGRILQKCKVYERYTLEKDKATYIAIIDGFEKLIPLFDGGDSALIEPQIDALIALSEKLPIKQ